MGNLHSELYAVAPGMNKLVMPICVRLAMLAILVVLAMLALPYMPSSKSIVFGPIVPESRDVISGKHIISTCGGAIYIRPNVNDVTVANNDFEAWPCLYTQNKK